MGGEAGGASTARAGDPTRVAGRRRTTGFLFPSMYDYHTCMDPAFLYTFVPRAAAVRHGTRRRRGAGGHPARRAANRQNHLGPVAAAAGRPIYLTLDDFDLRMQAEADPESLVARAPALILDEVQRARDLLIAIQRAVDQDPVRTPGRFVLTGSANLLMLERIGETLAGRAVYVTLWPFTRRERLGLGRTGAWSELLAAPFAAWREVLDSGGGPAEDWRAAARPPVARARLRADRRRPARALVLRLRADLSRTRSAGAAGGRASR